MMPVGTADGEANRALSQPPGFTLDAGEAHAIVNNEVVARVLSERKEVKTQPPEEQASPRGLFDRQ